MKRRISAGLILVLMLAGCAMQQPGAVNRDITTGIADAGSVANNAEQLYQAGKIPQNTGNRNMINGLGNAYNTARAAWTAVLNAESVYNAAQTRQITACAPGAVATGCTDATSAAATARTQLTTAQVDMNAKVSAMASQTSAVQSLAK